MEHVTEEADWPKSPCYVIVLFTKRTVPDPYPEDNPYGETITVPEIYVTTEKAAFDAAIEREELERHKGSSYPQPAPYIAFYAQKPAVISLAVRIHTFMED